MTSRLTVTEALGRSAEGLVTSPELAVKLAVPAWESTSQAGCRLPRLRRPGSPTWGRGIAAPDDEGAL